MSDYIDKVDIEGTQYDIQDTLTKEQAEENKRDIEALQGEVDYSTEEHLTGRKWLDGRPTYEKTVNCGALPNATTKLIPYEIPDLLFVVKGCFTAVDSGGNIFFPAPFPYSPAQGSVGFYVSGLNIVLWAGMDRTNFTQTFITLEYTKSTDSPQP